ncbi:MAG: SagB/ThcOx family dehydrogenase [candidate division WOR-3 bacterium]|nr:MAG: SagB/ThcOx family dehydrogenase [candidate division WOR-3 bacterium]
MVNLPAPDFTDASIEGCIQKRRSVRGYRDKELTLGQMSNILWAAQGITEQTRGFRAVPSAGATYPLEIFVAKKDGLYRYLPGSHTLKREAGKDLRKDIARAALGQGFISEAGMVVLITAVFERTALRYGDRAVRYVHIEAGHCAQNIHLEAVALGLGSVPVGAFRDGELIKLLQLKQEEPLYIIPVGYPD